MHRLRLGLVTVFALWALQLAPGQVRSATDSLGVISGNVVSAEDGRALQNASVILVGKLIGTVPNQAGSFRLERVPPGPQILRVMMVGRKKVDLRIKVLPGENSVGTIALEFQAVRMVVTGNPQGTLPVEASDRASPEPTFNALFALWTRSPRLGTG